jgi:simple sugar transport system permease protein
MTIRFERRLTRSRTAVILVPIASFILALLFGALLLLLFGIDPVQAYSGMVKGSLGSSYALSETLAKAIPLMLSGLGCAIAFRMLFWNIGAEGQLVMGGIAASFVALFLAKNQPWYVVLPLMMVFSILAGAVWGLIPAVLKATLRVNEILTTLMMNYIAIELVVFLYTGPWRDPNGFKYSAPFSESAWLPRLWGRAHVGLVFAVVAAALLWFILARTRLGYEIRVIGENPRAARYAGINIRKNILLVMLFSGGLAGLAGMAEVSAIMRRLGDGLAVGYGYTAIVVAWLAYLNPWVVLFVAFFMAALLVGGAALKSAMGLPAAVAEILQGAILFFVLGGSIFVNYRLRLVRSEPAVSTPPLPVRGELSQEPTIEPCEEPQPGQSRRSEP